MHHQNQTITTASNYINGNFIQEIYTTNNPTYFDIHFKLHAKGWEIPHCLEKQIVLHSVMDTKLHRVLIVELREMASCSEAWQLTLCA